MATPPVTVAPADDPERLLARAAQAPPREAAALRLRAATDLQADGDSERAYAIVKAIDPALLDPSSRFELNRLAARAALDTGDVDAAWDYIQAARPTNDAQGLSRELDAADIARARNDYVTAAHLLMTVDPDLAGAPTRQELNDDIWDALRGTPSSSVAALAGTTTDPVAAPWWQLAAAMDRAFDVAAQRAALSRWQARYPDHAGTEVPPTPLLKLAQLDRNVAVLGVLLPLTGPLGGAGNAVRDGIMAAFFHAGSTTRVLLYDTNEAPITALYEQALADGVDLIVGPLEKSRVDDLYALGFRQVPVLALNYLTNAGDSPPPELTADPAPPVATDPLVPQTAMRSAPDFFQFGLTIEQEARVIAERVAGDGARRVLILVNDADWSERATETFAAHWASGTAAAPEAPESESAGSAPETAPYAMETAHVFDVRSLTDVVGSALYVDRSAERMQTVADAIGQAPEFVPRRRHDIDAVVAFVNAAQGDAVKPALAYHFAAGIPVYATSQITSGRDLQRLTELNAMRICQLPWAVFPDPVRTEFDQAFRRQAAGPLQALGVDAYRLADRLTLLADDPHARLLGATGILTLDGSRVDRELVWAIVREGRLQPLPIVVN